MGINACILTWLDELAHAGAFNGLSSVLELGPQDFFLPPGRLAESARKSGRPDPAAYERDILQAGSFVERQKLFYGLFGLSDYASTDPYDDRADLRLDLNTATKAPNEVNVIADFGTTEHVFNAGNVFAFTHNSLCKGGIALKVLPTFGDNTHGFYNIHPTVYFDVARVNGYEMVDFRYIDNMSARSDLEGAASLFDPDVARSELHSFAGCARLQARISRAFLVSLARSVSEGRIEDAHNSVDYCFVCMRKLHDEPFVVPGQGVYLTEFS